MNIILRKKRKDGSLLLAIVVAVLVIVGGSIAAYYIYTWAVRLLDGGIYRGPAYTNVTPDITMNVTNLEYVGWQDKSGYFTNVPGSPAIRLSETDEIIPEISVLASLNTNNQIVLDIYNTPTNTTITFDQLGMPYQLDAYGQPSVPDFDYSSGTPPKITTYSVYYTLEKSSDLIIWDSVPVTFHPLSSGQTNSFTEPKTSGNMFYRAKLIP